MMRGSVRQLISFFRRLLTDPPGKQVDSAETHYIQKENIKLLSCSNVIVRIQAEGLDGYLCECRMHEPIRDYVFRFIDDYFACFCEDDEKAVSDRALILNSLLDPDNFKRFIGIGTQSPYYDSPYQRFLHGGDASEVGLDLSSAGDNQRTSIRRFVERYAWPQLTAYYAHRNLTAGKYHCRTTAKVLATQAMAQLLGLESSIPHAGYRKLIVTDADNRIIFGNFMENADGICAMDIPAHQRRTVVTPEFQRALLNMNLLDVICREQDHSPNNYNVVMDDEGCAAGVSIFDNNGAGTFSLNMGIDYETYKKCSSFLCSDGTVNRPCLDKAVAETVLSLTRCKVKKALSPYLREAVIWCTWQRIKKLQTAIQKSATNHPVFLQEKDAFSEQTIADELSGRYGKTYLISFLNDCLVRSMYN